MERKKWTAKAEVSEDLLKFREKRKWQLALRRYVLERNLSPAYASYFGLGIEQFRKWIEIHFTQELNWQNFGTAWQFGHIVPVAYFDFSTDNDLVLCWNFINIRVERIDLNRNNVSRIDVIAARPYFELLYKQTGYFHCLKMIEKISRIEASHTFIIPAIEEFIIENKEQLKIISSLSKDEFNNLNMGIGLTDILLEREILKKFG
ncbi:MAG: hypothetical protein H7Z13_20410 [Ferruginibacter sp.]|nr:hypothetical protein [Ferruginibacter sp.]